MPFVVALCCHHRRQSLITPSVAQLPAANQSASVTRLRVGSLSDVGILNSGPDPRITDDVESRVNRRVYTTFHATLFSCDFHLPDCVENLKTVLVVSVC